MKGMIRRRVAKTPRTGLLVSPASRQRGGRMNSARFRASLLGLTLALLASFVFLLSDGTPESAAQDVPEVSAVAAGPYTEGETAFFYLLHDRLDKSIGVSVTFTQSGNFLAPRQAGARTVALETGGYTQTTIRVPTVDDNRDEADGSITMTINPRSHYKISDPQYGSASVTVQDNDEPSISISDPAISIRAGSAIREGGTATFTLTANPKPASPVDVTVNVADPGNFAASGQAGTRTVTIGTNGSGSLRVVTTDDGIDQDDGRITVTVAKGSGYTVGSRASVSVVVTDGGAPTPRVSIAAGSDIDEGGTATFTLTANPVPSSALAATVNVTQQGDFGASGQTGSHTVTIGTDGRGTLSVATTNDEREEADGSITATLAAGSGYVLASSVRARVQVRDLGGIMVSIAPVGSAVIEGETATFRLTANPPPASSIDVNLRMTPDGDFVDHDSTWTTQVTIGSGGTATAEARTYDDTVDERNGSITATVLSGSDYDVGSPNSARIIINDDDVADPSRRTVSVGDGQLLENPRAAPWDMRFPVTLSSPADQWVIVVYETREVPDADHPATAGEDYRHLVRSVVFFPGETVKHASVIVHNDDLDEETETFGIVLKDVIGPAEIANGVAIGSILPDPHDATRPITEITISVQPAVVEGQPFTFTLAAMPPPKDDLPIRVTVTDGYEGDTSYTSDFIRTDREGEQTVTYLGDASLIWTLPEGQNYTRQTFTIPTVNDGIDEADGPVFVEVEVPSDDSYISQSPYRDAVIVYDNDGGAPQLPVISVSDGDDGQSTTELAGRVQFSVTLDKPVHPDGKVKVYYRTQSGTAHTSDYAITYGWLEFLGGDDHKYVEVRIIDDAYTEGSESFTLLLSRPQGATIGDGEGIATIQASD